MGKKIGTKVSNEFSNNLQSVASQQFSRFNKVEESVLLIIVIETSLRKLLCSL